MFGPRIRNVFRSRWQAVWWASTILITAYCSVPAKDEAPLVMPEHHPAAKHVNPWAKDAK